MGKTVIFLIFLILCSYTQSRTKNMEVILNQFVQLNQAAGKDKEVVSMIVSQVSSAFKDNNEREESVHGGILDRCTAGQKVLQEYIKKLETDLLALNANIEATKGEIEVAEKDGQNYLKQLENLKTDLMEQKKRATDEITNYQNLGAESEKKLVAIKAIRDVITDELLTPDGQSFLQLQTQEFSRQVNDLKNMLREVKAKESIFSPILSTLLQLAQNKNFADQQILVKVIEVLKKFEQNIKDFRIKQQHEGKQIIEDLKKSIGATKDQARNVVNLLQERKSKIASGQDNNINDGKNAKNFSDTIKRKKDEIVYWDNICKYQTKIRDDTRTWRAKFSEQAASLTKVLGDL